MRTQPARASERGTTLLEMAVFTAVVVPLMAALAATVTVFTSSTTESQHRANVNAQNHRILQKIVAELTQACTDIDHPLVGNAVRPQGSPFTPGTTNCAYDFVTHESLSWHSIDDAHENLERDGTESWHPELPSRRFYIYRTFECFDTIEYQKVHTPVDMSHVSLGAGTVVQPWSPRRKIFLMDGKVYLRVRTGPATVRSIVLGSNVEELAFHLNQDGHVIVKLTTTSKTPGSKGAKLTTQITVNPRNGLS